MTPTAVATRSRAVVADAGFAQSLLARLNRARARYGLRPLRVSTALERAARQHSVEMARKGYFDHDSPHGLSFAVRLERYYRADPTRMWWAAENILWVPRGLTAGAALFAFMHSAEHRVNILCRMGREIGISVVHASHAPGVYGGQDVTIITTDFGVR
jgi:uncharacterized protein YkwD